VIDLDADIVELAPYVPSAAAAPLREVAFRPNAWLPAEVELLRALFATDVAIDAIAAEIGRPIAGVRPPSMRGPPSSASRKAIHRRTRHGKMPRSRLAMRLACRLARSRH
jgi:hypothetical protein